MSPDASTRRDHSTHVSRSGCSGRWSGMNITAMVIGFVLFWPIGLIILGWIMSGRSVRELFALVRDKTAGLMPFSGAQHRGMWEPAGSSNNEVFNEYQQTQHDRIQEIKDEIKERATRFGEFRAAAKRRADREEFDRFMSDAPMSNGSH